VSSARRLKSLTEKQTKNYNGEGAMTALGRTCGLATAIVTFGLCAGSEAALDKKPVITLDLAKKMIAGCETKAQQQGWKMNIAIVDNGANLITFERMDGAFLGSGYVAQHKAMSSVNIPVPTRTIAEIAYGKDQQPPRLPGIALIPGIIAFPGGLPVMTADKTLIGAIGVSGSTSDNDEICAQAGLDAVKDLLD
jgi:glc operon protein GlcG